MICLFNNKATKQEILTTNGDYILDDICSEAVISEKTNIDYSCQFIFEVDKQYSDMINAISNDAIIRVEDEEGEEPFRIVNVIKNKKTIEVFAVHITIRDIINMWCEDVRPTDQSGQGALTWIFENAKGGNDFNVTSNISNINTAYYENMSVYNALYGVDNCFINRWGGETRRRGYNIAINDKIGSDRGMQIASAKNLEGFESKTSLDQLCTYLYVKGFDGIKLPGPIISPLVNNYSKPYVKEIKFEDIKVKNENNPEEGYNTLAEAQAEMLRRGQEQFSKYNIDTIQATYNINFVQLEKTEEYKDYSIIETAFMGDTVEVIEDNYNVNIKVRVTERKYNVLKKERIETVLSNLDIKNKPVKVEDILKQIENSVNAEGRPDLSTYIDAMMKSGIKDSYAITKQNETLYMDTKDINTATTVLRINKNGISSSTNGYWGKYEYGMTIDGKINASMITLGVLLADLIKAGTLKSFNNKTWIDMENGTFNFADKIKFVDGKFSIKLSGGEDFENTLTAANTNANKGIEDAKLAKAQADKGVADALAANNKAVNAQNTANTASNNANAANIKLGDIASDSKLTESEKKIAKKEWDIIAGEKLKIEVEAVKLGISANAFITQYNTLNTYITPLLANLNTTSDIVGETFRSNFTNYYNARQDLLNTITSKVKGLADTAQAQADKGVADALAASNKAATAQNTANAASNNANDANAKLSDIASDSKLTESEKKTTKKEWDIIVSEKAKIEAEGTKFGVSIADYTAKYNALNTYITPLLANINSTSDIVGTTFRSNFTNYYNARQDLLNAITTKAKGLADAAKIQADKGVADALAASNKAGQVLTDAKTYTNAEINIVKKQIELKVEATDIATAITNISIGGRNLLKDSGTSITSSNYNIKNYILTDAITAGTQVTVSLKGQLGAGKISWGIYNTGGSVGLTTILPSDRNSNGIYTKTFNWVVGSSANTVLWVYAMTSATTVNSTIEWINLEYGNKTSDWTPAPEDINKAITDTITINETKINQVKSDIVLETNAIKQSVTDVDKRVTTTNGNVTAVDTRLKSAEQKITPTAIVQTINESINNGTTSINTVSTTLDKTGFTVKNGAITIKDNLDKEVLKGDAAGNLFLGSSLITRGQGISQRGIMIAGSGVFIHDWSEVGHINPIGLLSSGRLIANGRSVPETLLANEKYSSLALSYKGTDGMYYAYARFDNDKMVNTQQPIEFLRTTRFVDRVNSDLSFTAPIVYTNNIGSTLAYDNSLFMHPQGGGWVANRSFYVNGQLIVSGSKTRAVDTKFGTTSQNAYETAECLFGDIGEGTIGKDGLCYIYIDPVMLETINTKCAYQVFLQVYDEGNAYPSERNEDYFVVRGTPGLRFGWELKAKQKGYENSRLEMVDKKEDTTENENIFEEKEKDVDYEELSKNYLQKYEEEIKNEY